MTFEDLPENWSELPLTTPGLAADVVDLLLGDAERCADTMLVLACGADEVGIPTPLLIDDIDWGAYAADRRRTCINLAVLCREMGARSAIMGISACTPIRQGRAARWRASLDVALKAEGIELLACFAADHDGITVVLPDLRSHAA